MLQSIRHRILLFTVAPITLIYVMTFWLGMSRRHDITVRDIEVRLTELARSYSRHFDTQLRKVAQIAEANAAGVQIHPQISEAQIYQSLRSSVEMDPLVYGAALAFEPGEFAGRRLFAPYVYRGPGGLVEIDIATESYDYTQPTWEWYNGPRTTGRTLWTEPYFDDGAGNILMSTYAVPFLQDGRFRGVTTVDIPLAGLCEQAGFANVPDLEFMVISGGGQTVYDAQPDRIMDEPLAETARRLNRPDLADLAAQMASGRRGITLLAGWDPPQQLWVAYAPIESAGWGFAVRLPQDIALAEFREQRLWTAGLLVVSLCVTIGCVWFVSGLVARPLASLAEMPSAVRDATHEARAQGVQNRFKILGYSVATMTVITMVVATVAIYLLYNTAVKQRTQSLVELADSQARLMEAVARFDRLHSDADHPEGHAAATMSQLQDAHRRQLGIGKTGELVLGRRVGDHIEFLLERRHANAQVGSRVPFDSPLAEPIRRALLGQSGTLRGSDYRGVTVLAAYEPITELHLGLVAKIDLAEIRSPFVNAALITAAAGLLVVGGGALLMVTLNNPLLKKVEDSETHLKTILNTSHEGFWFIDNETTTLDVNPSLCTMLGLPREQIVGRSVLDFVDADSLGAGMAHIRSRSTSEGTPFEVALRRPHGPPLPCLFSATPYLDPQGQMIGAFAMVTDISERKKAEAQFQKLHRAIEHSSSMVFITDTAGRIEYVNPSFERITGYPAEEAIGQNPRILKSGTHPPETYRDLWNTISDGHEWHGEFYNRRKNGEHYWAFSSISPIRNPKGRVTHYVAVAEDITDRKHAEQALGEAREAAEQANRAKSAFLANMSHELRTPMNAIIGYSEMLMEEAEDLEQDDFIPDLKKIHAAGKHLLALINDVLDLSKIEAGKMELFLETFEVTPMMEDVAATVDSLVRKNHNTLKLECAADLGAITADLTKVRQTLFNLLSNACKFTERGTITMAARRETGPDGQRLSFQVSDTGIGIAADKISRLFEEFTQADASTTRKYGGTGLGLAITKRFCEMMGGSITAESILGEGTTFTIQLPADVKSAAVEGTPGDDSTPGGEPPAEAGPVAEAQHTILVIDDDPATAALLSRTVSRDGFGVVTAANGTTGLELARTCRPVAIILDVLMPGLDGWAVLRTLKADPQLRDIPVIMVSMVEDRNMGYTLGAAEYLSKPVDRERLSTVLRRFRPAGSGRVLVVDDDDETRTMLRRILEKQAFEVDEAVNGQEGLLQMATRTPDLVLLDLTMPVMDGFGFVLEMRKVERWGHIPVVVLTAKDITAEDRKRLEGDVQQLVQKGAVGRDELLRQVRQTLLICRARTAPV